MHDTALQSGSLFAEVYGSNNKIVCDIGGLNVNGSLKNSFINNNMKFICVDLEDHPSVDIVIKPGDKLPFEDGSIDLIVSTSCFEHDPCFWLTFKEMCRVVKLGGYIYINAPVNGSYHCYPDDNWRFYPGAGQALAYWSGIKMYDENIYPVKVIETFNILPKYDEWIDFVCIWQRVNDKDTSIVLSDEIKNKVGMLEKSLNNKGFNTTKNIK
jgi:SAM-dependent methyltransferase